MTAPVYPGRALSFLTLGASLHDILTRLKASPRTYPNIDLTFSPTEPIESPILLGLPANGLRLRFDGPDQRLRLIEVLDFGKTKLSYKNVEVVKFPATPDLLAPPVSGPSFRHVYNRLFGPSFPGEYVPPRDGSKYGTYILSYPGIAFSFPVAASAWNPNLDFVTLLSSSAAVPASSLAIFNGSSWADAKKDLYSRPPTHPRRLTLGPKGKEGETDEVELVRIHGEGRVEIIRRFSPPFWVILSETTPQDLIAELGPPDAIYRKNDRRLAIHRPSRTDRSGSGTRDDTDTELSSNTTTDEDDDDDPDAAAEVFEEGMECFYNYFHHGFDIFLSHAMTPSPAVPGDAEPVSHVPTASTSLRATKILLHGNIPGSYPFNRHRRSRWELQHILSLSSVEALNSENPFPEILPSLKAAWKPYYSSVEEEASSQRGMVLNRGWGDSPGSSCELLGGWEESVAKLKESLVDGALGNTQLFGFPGLVFEVLANGAVGCLTVF